MKFIKVICDWDGDGIVTPNTPFPRPPLSTTQARYVRVDLFDEFIVEWNGEKNPDEAIYEVRGLVYNAPKNSLGDSLYYDIAWFKTFDEAEKYLAELIAGLNGEQDESGQIRRDNAAGD